MALQSSGEIRMSQINSELGRAGNATISLDTAESGGYVAINTGSASKPNDARPAAMSEWYSYDHSASSGPDGYLNGTPSEDPGGVCVLSYSIPLYKNGATSTPNSGEQLFTDPAKTTAYTTPTPETYYKYYDDILNRGYALFLLPDGFIEGVIPCD